MNNKLIMCAIQTANKMYGQLEDLHELLEEITSDDNMNPYDKKALDECKQALNDVELLDELIARLGCCIEDDDINYY